MIKYNIVDRFTYKGHTFILKINSELLPSFKRETRYKVSDGYRSIKTRNGTDYASKFDYDWLDPFVLNFSGKNGWSELARRDLIWFVNDNYIDASPLEYIMHIDAIEPAAPLKAYKAVMSSSEVEREINALAQEIYPEMSVMSIPELEEKIDALQKSLIEQNNGGVYTKYIQQLGGLLENLDEVIKSHTGEGLDMEPLEVKRIF